MRAIRDSIDELRTDGQRYALEVVGNQIVYGRTLFPRRSTNWA